MTNFYRTTDGKVRSVWMDNEDVADKFASFREQVGYVPYLINHKPSLRRDVDHLIAKRQHERKAERERIDAETRRLLRGKPETVGGIEVHEDANCEPNKIYMVRKDQVEQLKKELRESFAGHVADAGSPDRSDGGLIPQAIGPMTAWPPSGQDHFYEGGYVGEKPLSFRAPDMIETSSGKMVLIRESSETSAPIKTESGVIFRQTFSAHYKLINPIFPKSDTRQATVGAYVHPKDKHLRDCAKYAANRVHELATGTKPVHPKGEAVARDCDGAELRVGDWVEMIKGSSDCIGRCAKVVGGSVYCVELKTNDSLPMSGMVNSDECPFCPEYVRKLTADDGYYEKTGKVVRGAFKGAHKTFEIAQLSANGFGFMYGGGSASYEPIIKRCV